LLVNLSMRFRFSGESFSSARGSFQRCFPRPWLEFDFSRRSFPGPPSDALPGPPWLPAPPSVREPSSASFSTAALASPTGVVERSGAFTRRKERTSDRRAPEAFADSPAGCARATARRAPRAARKHDPLPHNDSSGKDHPARPHRQHPVQQFINLGLRKEIEVSRRSERDLDSAPCLPPQIFEHLQVVNKSPTARRPV